MSGAGVVGSNLPAIADPLLESPATRVKYEANGEEPEVVIDAFLAYCCGGTHKVAYNGTSLDCYTPCRTTSPCPRIRTYLGPRVSRILDAGHVSTAT
ncbi:MAG: hypothetical protein ABSA21_12900 [Candidatus Limnocylindrales bacterium]